jgi:hypothetical protein
MAGNRWAIHRAMLAEPGAGVGKDQARHGTRRREREERDHGDQSAAWHVARPSGIVAPSAAERGAGDMKKSGAAPGDSPSRLIDARIASLDDWRGKALAHVRALIRKADPAVVEEWKWNVPVWSHAGIICTGETYKSAVKLTFAKGASLADPSKLFNSSLEGNVRRAIDIREGDEIDEAAFKALIRAAASFNESAAK